MDFLTAGRRKLSPQTIDWHWTTIVEKFSQP